ISSRAPRGSPGAVAVRLGLQCWPPRLEPALGLRGSPGLALPSADTPAGRKSPARRLSGTLGIQPREGTVGQTPTGAGRLASRPRRQIAPEAIPGKSEN